MRRFSGSCGFGFNKALALQNSRNGALSAAGKQKAIKVFGAG